MSASRKAYIGAKIHDGRALLYDHGLVCGSSGLFAVLPNDAVPADCPKEHLGGGLITPGFVDLQVNGGGGVMFNTTPTTEGIATIAAAHRQFGTVAIMPTVITDAPKVLDQAAEAIAAFEEALVHAEDEVTRIRIRRHLGELYALQEQGRYP